MRNLLIYIILLCSVTLLHAQETDSIKRVEIKEHTVTAYKEEGLKETSLNITSLRIDSAGAFGNFNLTDLLTKIPGVSMLSSGVAISKPVIRGLYGNRVLVLVSGLKFDNQQWQEEHGLGLSDFGLSRVELIKGSMSVLYGTEALGGIVNLIEEEKPAYKTAESDASLKINSNTLGGLIQAGYKKNLGNKWFRIRIGAENNADYADGNNSRVLNSRFDAYYLKGSMGFLHKKWISNNYYLGSFNRFGFIFNDIYDFVTPDARYSRNLDQNPYHLVLLNLISSENKFHLNNGSKLYINAGLQSNQRMENEGGGAISLNMHLLTTQYLMKWETQLNERHKIIVSHLASFEDNTNYGARKIVPDARMQEANISVYYETTLKDRVIIENGIGVGEKFIKTFFTPSVNGPEKEVHPFEKFSPYYNGYTGISFIPNNRFNIKFNLATGVRVPNLAELSSNGLHEGIFTFEIGNPELKNEQSLTTNFDFNMSHQWVEFHASPFYNYFFNFIYLAPTTETWYGFPVLRYLQQNATQYGAEFEFNLKPTSSLIIGTSYTFMESKTSDGNYTPFIPAQKFNPKIVYTFKQMKRLPILCNLNADYYLMQKHCYPNELGTPQYWLLNAAFSTIFSLDKMSIEIGLAGNNLLNVAYYDHLSRFKNFGLLNIGRNIVLSLKVKFKHKIKE